MKIHEIAKKHNIKVIDLVKKLKSAELTYTLNSKVKKVDEERVENIAELVNKENESNENEKSDADVVKLIGYYYDVEKRRYILVDLVLPTSEFKELNYNTLDDTGTVYGAKLELEKQITKRGMFFPSKLEGK